MLSCTVAKIQKRTPRLHFPKCLHALCLESPSSPFYGHCFEQIQKKIILNYLSALIRRKKKSIKGKLDFPYFFIFLFSSKVN